MALGKKTGGRQKGALNKSTIALAEDLAAGGEMPRDYMLRVMRDESVDHPRRDDMAKAVAPYVHPKLAATEHTGKDGQPLIPETTDARETAKAVLAILRKAAQSNPPEGGGK